MQGKVEICGVNTAKLPVLRSAETDELLKRAGEGDKKAREELIQGNLRLVLSVIQRFAGRGENVDDLFQVGCIGLIKAIDNFDPSHEVRFSTYGVPMIAGEIRRYLRDNSALRISRSVRDTAYKVLQAKEKLTAEKGREPDVSEIAEMLGLPRQEVVFAMDAVCEPMSLYEPVYADGGDDDARARVARRFHQVMVAPEMASMVYYLRSFVQLLKAADIALDYPRLARDLYTVQLPGGAAGVRLQWGQDFYRRNRDDEEMGGVMSDEQA